LHVFHRHREAPGDLWVKCDGCHELIYRKEFEDNLHTCPKCNHHARISAAERIGMLADWNSWVEEDPELTPGDPLGFVSSGQSYTDKVAETQAKTGLREAAMAGTAELEDVPVRFAVLDFSFFGGSMTSVVGEKVARAAERSAQDGRPLIIVSCSGGARMQEGIYSLMQMAKTSAALTQLGRRGVPCISVLADPTTGGVTASFATLGDVMLAEPGALVGFAGPRVIEQTTRQKLPPDAQRPEFLLRRGMIDAIVHRRELKSTLTRVLRFYPKGPCEERPRRRRRNRSNELEAPAASAVPRLQPSITQDEAWHAVQLARNPNRPFTLDYAGLVFGDFFELHGDRQYGDDPAIVGGLATLGDRTVMLVGHQKGRTTQERLNRHFGMARPEGYRKALRLMHHAEKFGFPVITFIDTPGGDPSLEAEQRGQAWAIAESLAEMSALRVPIVAVVIGEGGSGGALAIGIADRLLMLENATYSVVSPEGCASILWNDVSLAPQAAAAMKITAPHLLAAGIADELILEPEGGAHEDFAQTGAELRTVLLSNLGDLETRFGRGPDLDVDALLEARLAKYRNIGVVNEPAART